MCKLQKLTVWNLRIWVRGFYFLNVNIQDLSNLQIYKLIKFRSLGLPYIDENAYYIESADMRATIYHKHKNRSIEDMQTEPLLPGVLPGPGGLQRGLSRTGLRIFK